MILVNELKGRIVSKGYTQAELAKKLGISSKTLSLKSKKGVFGSVEIEMLISLLEIENPMTIFLRQK